MKINAISSMNFGSKQNLLKKTGVAAISAPAVAITADSFVRGISSPNVKTDDAIKLLASYDDEEALGDACLECIAYCCGFPD